MNLERPETDPSPDAPGRRTLSIVKAATGDQGRFATRLALEVSAHERDLGRAARVVAGRSLGVEDCVELLNMLGLTAGPEPVQRPVDGS